MGFIDQSPRNDLLAAFPPHAFAQVCPHLEWVDLPLGKVLYESGSNHDCVYFPTSAVLSLLHVMDDGSAPEIAIVGHEGVVGISFSLGGEPTFGKAVVKAAGSAYRIQGSHLRNQFGLGGPVMYLLLRYTQALLTQISKTAECRRSHPLDQQFCRWLLLTLDRLNTDEVTMSRDLITTLLGSPGVIVAHTVHQLQKQGVIHFGGGHIKVLNRGALERCACECYAAVKAEYHQVLPPRLDAFGSEM